MRTALSLLAIALLVQGAAPDRAVTPTRATPLFNGRDLSGWTADVPEKDTNPSAPDSFVVRGGMLVSLGTPPGHLLTTSTYRNYRLEVEYRFPGKPGNCGVLVHASTPRALYKMFPQSIEVQMMHENAGDFWCIKENIEVADMLKANRSYSSQVTSVLPIQNARSSTSCGGPSLAVRPFSVAGLPIVKWPAGIATISKLTLVPGTVSVYVDGGCPAASAAMPHAATTVLRFTINGRGGDAA